MLPAQDREQNPTRSSNNHRKGLPYGFGGIAALGQGALPAEKVIAEHYHLGSTCAILSRSFCNTDKIKNLDEVRSIFTGGIQDIRNYERSIEVHSRFFQENRKDIEAGVRAVLGAQKNKQ